MSTEVAIKSVIAEWESRSTAVKLMIRSMVRSKIDMNAAAANRAKREEKKREKNDLAAKKRQEKEEAERAKREQKEALERAKQASTPVALRPPKAWSIFNLKSTANRTMICFDTAEQLSNERDKVNFAKPFAFQMVVPNECDSGAKLQLPPTVQQWANA